MAGKQGALSIKPTELPARYRERFAWKLDRRCMAVRELAADLVSLWQDLGGYDCLSTQERVLVERVAYLRRRVLDYETAVIHNATRADGAPELPLPMDAGTYSNHVNVLLGLMRALGLERRAKPTRRLHEHLESAA